MDQKSDSNEKTTTPDKDPLPIGKAPPVVPSVDSLVPLPPRPIIQQNIGPPPPDNPRGDGETDRAEPMLIRVVNDPLRTGVVGNDELGVFERSTLRYARWGVFVGAVTLLVIIGTAVVFWAQFREMSNQTDLLAIAATQARRDAKDAGIVTARQLSIAQQQAKAAQDSVKAIQRQMRLDQRPWIKVNLGESDASEKATWLVQVGGQLNVPIRFTNTGKTAAKHVRAIVFVEIIPKGKEPKLPVFPPPWGTVTQEELRKLKHRRQGATEIQAGRIFAGGHASNAVTRSEYVNGHAQPQFLSVPEANELVRKESYILMYGQVRYWDGFGLRHWSNFCTDFFTDGENANVTKCANYADDDNN